MKRLTFTACEELSASAALFGRDPRLDWLRRLAIALHAAGEQSLLFGDFRFKKILEIFYRYSLHDIYILMVAQDLWKEYL